MSARVIERLPRVPRDVVVEITNACNLRCAGCETRSGDAAADELTLPEIAALAEDLHSAGCRRVSLAGGEPLAREDWPRIASAMARAGLEVALVTNGLLLDEKRIARLVDAGARGVFIPLDGERSSHDAIRGPRRRAGGSVFDAAVRSLELLRASPLAAGVVTRVSRQSLGDLDALHERIAGLGAAVWQIELAMPRGRVLDLENDHILRPDDLPRLTAAIARFVRTGRVAVRAADNIGYYDEHEPLLRRTAEGIASFWNGCRAGIEMACIASNGDVKGCPAQARAFVAGNVRSGGFRAVWERPTGFAYNTAWREEALVGGCARCAFRRVCRAGCTAMAFAATGTVYDNPFCVQRSKRPGRID